MPKLPVVDLPPLTGIDLYEMVQKKKPTAGSQDGWGWRELKSLPVAWYDSLAVLLDRVELDGNWPDGMLDAYIAVIPKADGDATPLGQRPLCVLPVVYRLWASARLGHLADWFKSWVPRCVFALVVVVARLRPNTPLHSTLRRSLPGLLSLMFIFL